MLTVISSMIFRSKTTLGERNSTNMQFATRAFTLRTFARQLSLIFLTGGHLQATATPFCTWLLLMSIPLLRLVVAMTEHLRVPWAWPPFKWAVTSTRVRTTLAQSNGSVTKPETFRHEYPICVSPPVRIHLPTLKHQHLLPTALFRLRSRNATWSDLNEEVQTQLLSWQTIGRSMLLIQNCRELSILRLTAYHLTQHFQRYHRLLQ